MLLGRNNRKYIPRRGNTWCPEEFIRESLNERVRSKRVPVPPKIHKGKVLVLEKAYPGWLSLSGIISYQCVKPVPIQRGCFILMAHKKAIWQFNDLC